MNVALVQMTSSADKPSNLATISKHVELAASRDANLVVFPEAAMCAFSPIADELEAAEDLDGTFVLGLAALASRSRVAIIAGMFERVYGTPLVHNTVVAVGKDGALLCVYRKIHLFDAFDIRESDRFCAGPVAPVVFDLDNVRVGLITCYDLRFPELTRTVVADLGAELLVVPAAWYRGPQKLEHWRTLLRARAIENTIFVAGVGQNGATFIGSTELLDPMGRTIDRRADGEGLVLGQVDTAHLAEVRQTLPVLVNRRLGLSSTPA